MMVINSIANIHFNDYHTFVFDPPETSHGGTGFYIKESLVYVKRNDLKLNSPGNYKFTLTEFILLNRKKLDSGLDISPPE